MIWRMDLSLPASISALSRCSRHGGTTPITNPSPVNRPSPKYSASPSFSQVGMSPPMTAWANW